MAGSWRHMTTGKGRLLDNEKFCNMVENLGDAYETAEECFGMIWWLAEQIAYHSDMDHYGTRRPPRGKVLDVIRQAQANYKDGVAMGGVRRER